ncbi:hypothetical protein DFH08DRAFT_969408 [Mycena albidolilacea]|uniref:glucan endo-1,3-beta-D-glucosidase n=1 Tax=Mycena albidolilacea TaxID=1033008 RepID=A0AAD6ZHY3_9AGAR|nr:hypothetical protein DFH08DRAFT_969408 [Mycena albidolilacea]
MRATINYSRVVDPVATDAGVAYVRQRDLIKDALTTYGTDHVAGISVGKEFILNYLTENGGSQQDPNGGVGNIGAALLLANITDTISMLSDMNLAVSHLGTADAGSYFNTQILSAVKFGVADLHPWFAAQSIQDAVGWTWAEIFVRCARVGRCFRCDAIHRWIPIDEKTRLILTRSFIKQNTNGTDYFYFEYFDEGWKESSTVESRYDDQFLPADKAD